MALVEGERGVLGRHAVCRSPVAIVVMVISARAPVEGARHTGARMLAPWGRGGRPCDDRGVAATTRTSMPPAAWEDEGVQSRRFSLLLCTVLAAVAVQGAVQPGAVQQVAVSTLLAASLLLSFRIARASPPVLRLAIALAVAGVAVSVLRAATGAIGDGEARVMNALLVILGPPAVGLGVVRNLRAHRQVRLEAVMGVLSLYMLLGLLFAFVYGAIDRLGGDPFFAGGEDASVAHCVYFSFTTLTTSGFGDFTARTDVGHTLTILEALIGQIYLVTVVSLIVSNLGRRGQSERAAEW
jgi:hypothetical protein